MSGNSAELWKEGVKTKPSEVFWQQIYVDFWYEKAASVGSWWASTTYVGIRLSAHGIDLSKVVELCSGFPRQRAAR